MEPTSFPESNKLLKAPPQMENCIDMPVWTDGRMCVSRWRLGFLERVQVLIWGRIWVYVFSGATQPPIALIPDRTVFTRPAPAEDVQ